jgi:GNAT acetyltransferase
VKEPVHRDATTDDLRLLEIDIDTTFVMSPTRRILRENDPDRSPGPRVSFVGCPFGNITRVRFDVDDRIADKILEVAAKEPPWSDPDVMPRCSHQIIEFFSDAPPPAPERYLIYRLPNDVSYAHRATIVRGDSEQGRQLLAHLAESAMPDYMVAAGFKSIADFWEPWCVALDAGEIASMCFAARLGAKGAEAGVYTFPQYRGRGLAAAVTASWSSMPALKDRALFYSTSTSNRSSQRVAARLGLRQIGASFSIR